MRACTQTHTQTHTHILLLKEGQASDRISTLVIGIDLKLTQLVSKFDYLSVVGFIDRPMVTIDLGIKETSVSAIRRSVDTFLWGFPDNNPTVLIILLLCLISHVCVF